MFCLESREEMPASREEIAEALGVAVAMASDFNPGSCPSANLQFVMNLGCLRYRLTPEEVLTAVTLNAAAANVSFVEVDSDKGHDAFLLDEPEMFRTLSGFLKGAASARGLRSAR